jgi:NAD(P)-dependent dehydrogenase (short-subunit alcohol dehydrogenase family)
MRDQKVALVTGVSPGIGRAAALLLSSRGFRVSGTVRHLSDSDTRTGNLEFIPLDVRDEESVEECAQSVLDQARKIDVVVNNAGYTLVGALEETSI